MLERIKILWGTARDSLWFIPALLTLAAVAMAVGLVRLEQAYEWKLAQAEYWFLGGGADGARQVLSTIAGSLITVTGVVFSVTIVALQLASSQFTPRILRNFMADRSNQLVLGVFISTFTYTLVVLRVIRSKDENGSEFVPHVAVAVAIILMLLSIGFLIYFIHHAARSMQAGVILRRVTAEALYQVDRLFPEEVGEPDELPLKEAAQQAENREIIVASRGGYLQVVDGDSLFKVGQRGKMLIRMTAPIGSFIVPGQALAEVWSDDPCEEELADQIKAAFILGEERQLGQDVEFCIVEIGDIAVKALSPGINDPTTALHCIDRLTQILLALGKRRAPAAMRTDSGRVHFIALHTTFEEAVDLAFNQIIHFGSDNPVIVGHAMTSVDRLADLLPAERHAPLLALKARINDAVARQ